MNKILNYLLEQDESKIIVDVKLAYAQQQADILLDKWKIENKIKKGFGIKKVTKKAYKLTKNLGYTHMNWEVLGIYKRK